ncbi:MAG: sugar phosphate isomerase/epimerase family protein [Chthonomonadales bacterium]
MRFAICNEMFQQWSWEDTCRFAAQVGYEGIEVAPFTLAEDVRNLSAGDRTALRDVAERAGLMVVGLHWLLVSPKGLSLTSDDRAVREATATYLVALAEFCADLGGAVMVLGSPAQRRIPQGCSIEEAEERFCASIRPALDRAAERAIRLCIEPLPPPEADFILTLEDASRVLARLEHPAAFTILDVKSACAERDPIPVLIHRYAGKIAHVHANDANRRGPGFGDTDFGPILAALQETKYSGFVSVEVFDYSPDPQTIARTSLAYLRAAEGDPDTPRGAP